MEAMPTVILDEIESRRKQLRLSYAELSRLVTKLGAARGTGVKISPNHLREALQGKTLLSWGRLMTLLDLLDLEIEIRRKEDHQP